MCWRGSRNNSAETEVFRGERPTRIHVIVRPCYHSFTDFSQPEDEMESADSESE